jgi:LPS-assembly protein
MGITTQRRFCSEGNVVIDQEGRQFVQIKSPLINSNHANAQGRVQLLNQVYLPKRQINYNLKTPGDLNNSFYISEQQHAHGHASKSNDIMKICFKRCKLYLAHLNKNQLGKFKLNKLNLNQETGRGVTRNKTLCKRCSCLAVPYFNFPIDDRRTTGILNPNFGLAMMVVSNLPFLFILILHLIMMQHSHQAI